MPKLAMYAICKNESKIIKTFIEHHLKEIREDDEFIILDTGSTDDTFEIIKQYPKIITKQILYEDFRYDNARNDALNMISKDIDVCISIDIDEKLSDNWRNMMDKHWDPFLNKLHFPYIYSWEDDEQTIPSSAAYQEKVHSRHDYKWIHRIHERLEFIHNYRENRRVIKEDDIVLYHYPDMNKEKNYLPMCILSAQEEPNDYWVSNYLAQEYRKNDQIDESIKESKRLLKITNDYYHTDDADEDVAVVKQLRASICVEIADMYYAYKQAPFDVVFQWLCKAMGEFVFNRDIWMRIAEAFLTISKKDMALECIIMGERFTEKGVSVNHRYWDKNYMDQLKLQCLRTSRTKKSKIQNPKLLEKLKNNINESKHKKIN